MGASGSVAVTANAADFEWTAVSSASWLSVTSGSPGMGSSMMSYTVAANPGTAARTATVTIANQTFTVTQAGYNPLGAAPAAQSLTLSADGGVAFTATTAAPWLAVSPASGTVPATVLVTVRNAGLAAGQYNGSVTLTPAAPYDPVTVPVTLTVAAVNDLTAAPGELLVAAHVGDAGAAHYVSLTSAAPLNWTSAVTGGSWLSAAASGTAPGTLALRVDAAGLAPGTYRATVTVTAANATNGPVTIPVTLSVTRRSTLTADPESLRFEYEIAGALPSPQKVWVDANSARAQFGAWSSAACLKCRRRHTRRRRC